ncbi:MAG: conjugal transfer protein TraX [Oscillospiraceae bacterium]|nr:conjugal transfer protein TraX [Oscillospiraceae bacterium]
MLRNLNACKLKWIAIIGMVLSHMTYAWWDIMPFWLSMVLNGLGGLTFAIMAYFVVEGYRHTSNLLKYIGRLLLFGLIAAPFHFLVIGFPSLNIMFTIALGLVVLLLYDKIKIKALFWVLYVIVIVPVSLIFEMYFIGVTMILLFHIIKNENARRIVPPIFAGVCWLGLAGLTLWSLSMLGGAVDPAYGGLFRNAHLQMDFHFMMTLIPFGVVCALTSVLLKNYNGERGKRMKWTFYVIYPLHFAVLAAIGIAIGTISLSMFGF